MFDRPARFRGVEFLIVMLAGIAAVAPVAWSQTSPPQAPHANDIAIVLLGTGTPNPDADRQGSSLAIIANGKAYLVDAGTGVVRQANSGFRHGIPALQPARLDIVFLTHLHSDHTLGLPDLILTPWVLERTKPLRLYGPEGTKEMAEHILNAYKEDIQVRMTGLEHANATGYKVEAHDIEPGNVYQDENVKVTAFLVKHGSWKEALGYRFVAGGKTIVVSGDTSPVESVVEACSGCDALIHEVHAGSAPPAGKSSMSGADWMEYEHAFHTSAAELGDIAARAKAKTLILMHWGLLGHASESDMLQAIRDKYTGPIIIGRDLDVIAP